MLHPHAEPKIDRELVGVVEDALTARTPALLRSASSPHLALGPPPPVPPPSVAAIDLGFTVERPTSVATRRTSLGTRQRAATLPRADAPALPPSRLQNSSVTMDDFIPLPPGLATTATSVGSPSSSRSSLISLPGLTTSASPSSVLSAIPESPPLGPLDSNDTDVSSDDDGRFGKNTRTLSLPAARQRASTLPPSSIVTQAFAAGRAPSIDQVLTRDSSMDDVLEKLRLHGGS